MLARADAGLPALPLESLELTPLVRDICEQGQVLAEARQLEISTDLPESQYSWRLTIRRCGGCCCCWWITP